LYDEASTVLRAVAVNFDEKLTLGLHIERIEAKAFRIFMILFPLLKRETCRTERLSDCRGN
jgi:hypothetical protein